jgi:hypothetical protein
MNDLFLCFSDNDKRPYLIGNLSDRLITPALVFSAGDKDNGILNGLEGPFCSINIRCLRIIIKRNSTDGTDIFNAWGDPLNVLSTSSVIALSIPYMCAVKSAVRIFSVLCAL